MLGDWPSGKEEEGKAFGVGEMDWLLLLVEEKGVGPCAETIAHGPSLNGNVLEGRGHVLPHRTHSAGSSWGHSVVCCEGERRSSSSCVEAALESEASLKSVYKSSRGQGTLRGQPPWCSESVLWSITQTNA